MNCFKSTCPHLYKAFPELSSGSTPFYDSIRDCLHQHQEDKMRAWEESGANTTWWGEGDHASIMHNVLGIYMDDR